jgi:hypothetical protein
VWSVLVPGRQAWPGAISLPSGCLRLNFLSYPRVRAASYQAKLQLYVRIGIQYSYRSLCTSEFLLLKYVAMEVCHRTIQSYRAVLALKLKPQTSVAGCILAVLVMKYNHHSGGSKPPSALRPRYISLSVLERGETGSVRRMGNGYGLGSGVY